MAGPPPRHRAPKEPKSVLNALQAFAVAGTAFSVVAILSVLAGGTPRSTSGRPTARRRPRWCRPHPSAPARRSPPAPAALVRPAARARRSSPTTARGRPPRPPESALPVQARRGPVPTLPSPAPTGFGRRSPADDHRCRRRRPRPRRPPRPPRHPHRRRAPRPRSPPGCRPCRPSPRRPAEARHPRESVWARRR